MQSEEQQVPSLHQGSPSFPYFFTFFSPRKKRKIEVSTSRRSNICWTFRCSSWRVGWESLSRVGSPFPIKNKGEIIEILTKTDSSLADHVFVRAAIDVVEDVLRKCNNFKKESSESENIYRQVKNIPVGDSFGRLSREYRPGSSVPVVDSSPGVNLSVSSRPPWPWP